MRPRLLVDFGIAATPDDGGPDRRRVGLSPTLWILFLFVYSAHVAAIVGGVVHGLVHVMLGQSPMGWYVAVFARVTLHIMRR